MKKFLLIFTILFNFQIYSSNLAFIDAVEFSKELLKKKSKLVRAQNYWQAFAEIYKVFDFEYRRQFDAKIFEKLYQFRKGKVSENEIWLDPGAKENRSHDVLKKYIQVKNKIEEDIKIDLKEWIQNLQVRSKL